MKKKKKYNGRESSEKKSRIKWNEMNERHSMRKFWCVKFHATDRIWFRWMFWYNAPIGTQWWWWWSVPCILVETSSSRQPSLQQSIFFFSCKSNTRTHEEKKSLVLCTQRIRSIAMGNSIRNGFQMNNGRHVPIVHLYQSQHWVCWRHGCCVNHILIVAFFTMSTNRQSVHVYCLDWWVWSCLKGSHNKPLHVIDDKMTLWMKH